MTRTTVWLLICALAAPTFYSDSIFAGGDEVQRLTAEVTALEKQLNDARARKRSANEINAITRQLGVKRDRLKYLNEVAQKSLSKQRSGPDFVKDVMLPIVCDHKLSQDTESKALAKVMSDSFSDTPVRLRGRVSAIGGENDNYHITLVSQDPENPKTYTKEMIAEENPFYMIGWKQQIDERNKGAHKTRYSLCMLPWHTSEVYTALKVAVSLIDKQQLLYKKVGQGDWVNVEGDYRGSSMAFDYSSTALGERGVRGIVFAMRLDNASLQ